MFHVPLFTDCRNRHKILRSLENNILEAFKISRFCFFDLRGDLGCLEASELENRGKNQQADYQILVMPPKVSDIYTELFPMSGKIIPSQLMLLDGF